MLEDSNNSDDVWIVTSLDSPYAIADEFRRVLRKVKNSLRISTPWFNKGFGDLLRNLRPRAINIKMLVRSPEKVDRTYRAVEAI